MPSTHGPCPSMTPGTPGQPAVDLGHHPRQRLLAHRHHAHLVLHLAESRDDAAGMAAGNAEDVFDAGFRQDTRHQHPRRHLLGQHPLDRHGPSLPRQERRKLASRGTPGTQRVVYARSVTGRVILGTASAGRAGQHHRLAWRGVPRLPNPSARLIVGCRGGSAPRDDAIIASERSDECRLLGNRPQRGCQRRICRCRAANPSPPGIPLHPLPVPVLGRRRRRARLSHRAGALRVPARCRSLQGF